MLKYFSLALISFFVSLFLVGNAFADTVCQPVYGGGQSCVTTGNIQVIKTIDNPKTFGPGDTVIFRITLTNTGGTTIQQIAVRDDFKGLAPPLTFAAGPGSFDSNAKVLTFTTDNLAPNETRNNFLITMKVADATQLPSGKFCLLNQVSATTNTGQRSEGNAQVCIEKPQVTTKGGLPVFPPPQPTVTPPTGPELIPLISLLPGSLAGFFLRRKSNKLQGGK